MRLSDLLDTEVLDRDGGRVGRVVDVRLVEDGPVQFPYGSALRVDGLIVATGRWASRLLGYERDVRPAVFRRLVHATSGDVRYLPFHEVERLTDGRLRTTRTADECMLLDDVPPRRSPQP